MAGIYIHIPFCRQACHYCNFHFSTSLLYKSELIDALLKEIELTPPFLTATGAPETIDTIYFGGGTPSLCTAHEVQTILEQLHRRFPVSPGAEITLEANPDDISEDKLAAWKTAGVNRLSIGVQSFFEEDLQWMNRAHNSTQAISGLEAAIRYFDNITIDLIYGTPQLTDEKWKYNVDMAIALAIPHLSCYALTVEPQTPLDKLIRQQKSPNTDPGQQSEQFLLLMEWMEAAGYEHYEISNFARPASPAGRPGSRSRHNSSYWQGKRYYGFGPSAHSFDGQARWWNVANNNQYIRSIQNGVIPLEKEVLTPVQQVNEQIMIALRTREGLDVGGLRSGVGSRKSDPDSYRDGGKREDDEGQMMDDGKRMTDDGSRMMDDGAWMKEVAEAVLRKSRKYIEQGLMVQEGDRLVLTQQGKLLADGIAADLFIDQ